MFDTSIVKKDLHDVHQLCELGENEDLVPSLDQLGKDPIQKLELSTGSENVVSLILWFQIVQEEIRMITYLSQLHDCVSQGLISNFASGWISGKHPIVRDSIVDNSLPRR